MRVLCVTPWFPNFPSDGKFNFIFHSVRALAAAGHDVTVMVTRPWVPRALASASDEWAHARAPIQSDAFGSDLCIEVVRYLSIPRYILSEYADALYKRSVHARLRQVIREKNIQIVHGHTERAGVGAVNAGLAERVPAVVTLHGVSTAPQLLDSPGKRARIASCLQRASRVVLVGEPLRPYFAPLAGGDANFRIVPNGFFLSSTTDRQILEGSTVRFVSVANLNEGKGIELNLDALSMLDAQGRSQWTYDVVGSGPHRAELEAQAERLGLRARVTFHGALAHDAVTRVLAENDVFILPSYREAFGVAYLEAMAAGLLTIGVAGQGPEAFIVDGQSGFLVAPRSAASLASAMLTAFEQPARARLIAAAGQRHVAAEFTWARHAEKLTAVYEEARRA